MAINRDKVLEAAQKYVEKKKYDKAVQEYQKLIVADPNDARTLLKIGDLQAKQGLHGDAVSTYESVGKLYAHQGFALKAIAVYKQIREIVAKHVPQLEERYWHITPKLAELYQQLGLTSDALAALDEVATRLQRQQRDREAIDVFHKIVELDPTNPLPHLRLAEALSRVQDTAGAVFEFKTAASQLAGIGRRDDALKVLERLLHHKPDAEQARIAAELYLSRGQPQDGMQALSKLQICFQANPRDFDTLSLLARAFNTIGQGTKAIEVQKEMARVARDAGKQDLFREIVERLLRVAPHDDGVRKLAAQSGSIGSVAPGPSASREPSYRAPAGAAPAPGFGEPSLPQPPTWQGTAPRHPAGAGAGPNTLPRPATAAEFPPPLPPEAIDDEDVEELSYEEVESEAVLQEVAEAEAEAEDLYERQARTNPRVDAFERHPPHRVADANAYAPSGSGESDAYDEYDVVEVDGSLVDAEELEVAPDTSDQLRQVLIDAGGYQRAGLYDQALETLRVGLQIEPRSMELHEVYRDILIESGQTEDAVEEMLRIATLYVDALDGESAARALQDVLAFDPQNARAIDMLQELGYEIVEEEEEDELAGSGDAPLPAYDLEGGPHVPPAAHGHHETDHSALPSFPLDEPETYSLGARGQSTVKEDVGAESNHELEDALDEAEFFVSRGLVDDARAILQEQLAKHPNHPLLRERVAELDAQEAEQFAGSGARERPVQADPSFDINASLDALENLDYDALEPAEGHAEDGEQVDVEEVFAKFKEGVAKQISVDDSDSHYNLGIAYKEMMLIDDAIREFEMAAKDPKRECVCRSMIGMIEVERGRMNEAIDAFLLGLNSPNKDPQQETVLCYEIGSCYEAKRMNKEALSYYQKAMRRDPNYRDVQDRVRRLAKVEPKTQRPAAVGADDEFDRAFDDLVSKA